MSDIQAVEDSQPEEQLDQPLSWDYINKEKRKTTRKAKQLDKLYKDLHPLNNEYKNVPSTKSRHTEFHRNNQFTVVAAEFLNLSTKSELDRMFDDGYTKDEIENMLENKYQEKKAFFTELNIKHHKFKRKNFESWRSLSNSSLSTNTFALEEELMPQMSKPQQLRLKRINNKPLKKYKTVISDNTSTVVARTIEPDSTSFHRRMRSNGIIREGVPKEHSLLTIPSTDASDYHSSSLMVINDINDDIHNNKAADTQSNLKNAKSGIQEPVNDIQAGNPSSPIFESPINNNINLFEFGASQDDLIIESQDTSSIEREKTLLTGQGYSTQKSNVRESNNDNLSSVSSLQNTPQSSIVSPFRDDVDSQLPDTQMELHDIFSDKKDTTAVSSNITKDGEVAEADSLRILSSPGKAIEVTPVEHNLEIEDNNFTYGRNLRHRTIVNRNPYLVDRAEYLGLSTKYELISMEESGQSDNAILAFLDSKYQKRRKERKDKEVGYGPFSKSSFYEIMAGKDQIFENNDSKIADSMTDVYQMNPNDEISDQEFELSMDEESDINEEGPTESHIQPLYDDEIFQELNLNQNPIKRKDKSKDTDKVHFKFNLREITKDSEPELDQMVQKRKRKRKLKLSSKSSSAPKEKAKKQKTTEHRTNHSVTRSRSVSSMRDESPSSVSTSVSKFNPYAMDLLTLSDDEYSTVQVTDKATPNRKPRSILNLSDDDNNDGNNQSPDSNNYGKNKNDNGENNEKRVISSTSISEILGKTAISIKKPSKNSNGNSISANSKKTNSLITKICSPNKNKNRNQNIIGSFYAPISDTNYVFNRSANVGSYQEEITKPDVLEHQPIQQGPEFNIEFAKNTGLNLLNNDKTVASVESKKEESFNIQALWNKYEDIKDVDKRRYTFILNLKPLDYKGIKISQVFLSSSLFVKTLSETGQFYRNKCINLEFLSMKISFAVPLKAENTFSQIMAFHGVLLGSLKGKGLAKHELKQLRKALINIIMILSNIKNDCPEILPGIGLEMNSFLNKYKKTVEHNEISFCIFAPYFLIYMKMFQKFLPASSEYISTFKNSESWLCKKIVQSVCTIPFEKVFVHVKSILIESLFIFLKCTSNPWSYVESIHNSKNFDMLNIFNFLYFCNSYHNVEMDWEFFSTILTKYSDKSNKQNGNFISIKNIFASILKLNRELKWELEDQLLIKMFRLLAEYKFENIGTSESDKPTIYPNIPGTDSLTEEDGCLDIYFKILNIYTKQYLSENTKVLVERLIPIRSTFGYSPVQLQNRAKLLLMMVYTFDQDLLASLESILNDMIRNGSLYSIKSSLALIRTIIRQTPKRPYNLVRKYLPSLVKKINHLPQDREVPSIFKDLIYTVNELLNGQDISHLKRMLDFFAIILQLKHSDVDPGFDAALNKTFVIITQQYEFLKGVQLSDKDQSRLNKSLSEIISHAKLRLLDDNASNLGVNKSLLKYWLYASAKSNKPAIQLLYTEWNYFGNERLREKYEIPFFSYLVQMFDVANIREDILTVLFKYFPLIFIDLSSFFQNIVKQNLLPISRIGYENISSQIFKLKRIEISIKCLSKLLKDSDEKLIYHVLQSFVISLKNQLINHEAKNYIKEVSLYLYTVANDRFEIPEWDYLVNKLKLETVVGSISKKIQFVETVEDAIVILEKSYVGALVSGTLQEFKNEFIEFTGLQTVRDMALRSLCFIISFHVETILKKKPKHWSYLCQWMEFFSYFVKYQVCKQDMTIILKLFYNLSRLKSMFPTRELDLYYYYKVLTELYSLLAWTIKMFLGFEDGQLFIDNFPLFAGMDPKIKTDNNNLVVSMITASMEAKLSLVYQNSEHLLQNKPQLEITDRELFVLEEKLSTQRQLIKEDLICLKASLENL